MDKATLYARAFTASLTDQKMSVVLSRLKDRLLLKGEMHLLLRILKMSVDILEHEDKTVVTSRYPLDVGEKKKIFALLEKNFGDVDTEGIEFETNEKVLGGASILRKDFLYDATVKKQIEKIK